MRALWRKVRYRIEWLALFLLAKVVPLLSRNNCYRLAQILGASAAVLDRPGRRIALSNLALALPNELSAARRVEVVRESYQQFARTLLDLCWSTRLTKDNVDEFIEVVGGEAALREISAGHGIIFTTFHYGNFEWTAQMIGLHNFPALTLAQEFKNPLLEPIVARLRKHSGNKLAPRERGIVHMYKALRRGQHVAVLTDLTLKPWDPSVAINCFGMKKCVTYAHAWLHQRTGAPIIPAWCEPLPEGRYRVHVLPKLEVRKGMSIVEITQHCWDQIEPFVRQNPSPWVWMYKHWRYRLAGSAKPYPFYANSDANFEARLNAAMARLQREVVQ